jgi:hypothetical protein
MRIFARRLLPAAALLLLAAPSSALASGSAEVKEALGAGVAYLKAQQLKNGSFSGFGGEWTLSALAAAGVAAANVERGEAGASDARSYYRALVGDPATWPGSSEAPVTDYETAALAAYAAGLDPARLSSSQNLIAQIVADYQPAHPGYYGEPGLFNGTVFALLALADAKTQKGLQRVPQALLEPSVAAIDHNQHTDGGWGYSTAEGNPERLEEPGEVEFTGAAIAALCGAGVPASNPAIAAARGFLSAELKAEPLASGAFETEFGPNTDSNAWAVEGLNACDVSATSSEFTTSRGKTPIDFLLSQQLASGGVQYEPGEGKANLYSTQDAVRALSGAGFTVPPPKAKGAKQWLYEKYFTPGTPALITLILDDGSSLTPCAVTLTPSAKKTTLGALLGAAETKASPAGCVTGFTPTTGSGAITQVNGQPSPPAAKWKVSIDGGAEKAAKRSSPVAIGDTVYLNLG